MVFRSSRSSQYFHFEPQLEFHRWKLYYLALPFPEEFLDSSRFTDVSKKQSVTISSVFNCKSYKRVHWEPQGINFHEREEISWFIVNFVYYFSFLELQDSMEIISFLEPHIFIKGKKTPDSFLEISYFNGEFCLSWKQKIIPNNENLRTSRKVFWASQSWLKILGFF